MGFLLFNLNFMKRKLLVIGFVLFTIQIFAQSYRNEWIDYSKTYYKFKVSFGTNPTTFQPIKKGLVRISQSTLATAGLGNVSAEKFKLYRNGIEVAIYTSVSTGILGSSDYIEFWGEINDGKLDADMYRQAGFQLSDIWSLQEDAGTYFLTSNDGINKRYTEGINSVSGTTLTPTLYFMNTISFTNRGRINEGFAAQATFPLYSSSYDRGEGWSTRPIRPIGSSCGQVSYTVNFTNLKAYASGPTASLSVTAVGSANNARKVLVKLNGDSINEFQMDYYYDNTAVASGIPITSLSSGTASIQHINKSIVDCDEFRLVKDELTYPRTLDCNNQTSLELRLPITFTGHYLKFYNFNKGGTLPILYDLTNNKRYVADTTIADTVRFVTESSFTPYNLVLVQSSNSNALNIPSLQQRNFINYASAANQGDYVIISNPLIYGSGSTNYVEQYKNYRSSINGGGYNSILVDINEITDQFAYGVKKHPLSIKNFLRYARNNFSTVPKYAFLIGRGITYIEYRTNETASDIEYQNLVPTWGSPASDNLLASEDVSNAIPAIPIGRLSAVSAAEVGTYLNKIKEYDSVRNSPSTTITDKAWMKNVLQVAGTNDVTIASTLDDIINDYKSILEDTSFGARARNYDKLHDPSAYTESIKEFQNIYEKEGASIVSYFGHSSSTSLDFNLDNPDAYNNQKKYPFFFVNGCDAANYYVYEPSRMTLRSTLSEKFVLEPNKGAIGYVATTGYGMVNYLDSFTTKILKNLSKSKYNKPLGEAFKQGIADVLATTGYSDYFARYHSEQFVLHGDPALVINSFAKPDYAIEAQQLSVSPAYISVADDSFYVKIRVHNLGKKTIDSVNLSLTRHYPSGSSQIVYTKKLASIAAVDSVIVSLPIVSYRDRGNNILTATIDNTNNIDEISETNNSASITAVIKDDEIIPVYPYKYAIVNTTNFKLSASTANSNDISKTYVMEIDTTALFNSPLKYSTTKTSIGGVVEFDKGITLVDSTTYYWRVAIQGNARWNTSSFTYKATAPYAGFMQQHFYQHTENDLSRIYLDTTTRKFMFKNKLNNLFMIHSIYPTSGTGDQQFSIQVNGSGIIASACLGHSVIINVFDTLTFKPWENLINPFDAEPTCDVLRKYNFEYHYIDSIKRNNARQFLESIPNGMLVAVRLVYDGDAVWANEWAADSSHYGSNHTLYSFLKQQGLPIDSFYFPRTFGIVFKKNDSANFAPQWEFTQGIYDRVVMSVDFNASDTLGYITSKKFGPAKTWRNVKWKGNGNVNNLKEVYVYGINATGTETKLYTLDSTQTNVDISSVNATQYPYLKLQLKNQDSITAIPYQLKSWSVEFDEVPEGVVAPNILNTIPDSAGNQIVGGTNYLQGKIAFKNVSKVNYTDSLTVKLVLTSQTDGTVYTYNLPKIKPLVADDTAQVNINIDVSAMLTQMYNAYIVINENGTQKEQYLFNNYYNKFIYLKTNGILPVQLVNFNAQRNGKKVEINWNVTEEINISNYVIQHSNNSRSFTDIGSLNATANNSSNKYQFTHNNPSTGKNYYRLKIFSKDGTFTYSPVRMVNFNLDNTITVYPNPVKDKLNVIVENNYSKPATIKVMNIYGQVIYKETFAASTIQIDFSKYAAATYFVQVDDGIDIQTFKVQKN